MIMILSRIKFAFSQIQAPTISLSRYLNKSRGWEDDCKQAAEALHKYGLLYAEDSRVNAAQNDEFLNLMEQYFAKRSQQFDMGERSIDVVKSELPIGLMHCYHEKFVNYKEDKDLLKPPHLSQTPDITEPDPTWRFHYILNSKKNVKPADFPSFESIINSWGTNLKNCALTVAQMAAIGLGLDKHALSDKIVNGDFYMSPTGIDLAKSEPGKLLTSFHRDFDLLTIHGKSRYAGLYAWLNTGEKFLVKVPTGQLLVQGGKQLEWLTGGYIKAGFHEVIHNELVEEAKLKVVKEGKHPWRVASTLFCQVEGGQSIKPLEKFQTPEINKKYPDLTADQYIAYELQGLYVPQK